MERKLPRGGCGFTPEELAEELGHPRGDQEIVSDEAGDIYGS